MSELVQDTRETLERHEHLAHGAPDPHGRRIALLIGILAAVLAICDMSERSAQNAYLAHHIAVSDQYAFLQARETRALVLNQSATLLDALPSTPQTVKAALAARAEAMRLTVDSDRGNGVHQIQARATAETKARDAALDRYEWFEIVTSGLQIAIVLASVSVVTRIRSIAFLGGALGVVATGLALLVVTGVV
jgi:Flp pilus assembly CpaE family ATPase